MARLPCADVRVLRGVSALTICDNLRSRVTHPDRCGAEVNAAYRDFASHFGTCVLPTRVRHFYSVPYTSSPSRGRLSMGHVHAVTQIRCS